MSGEELESSYRRPYWSYFAFPAGVIVIAASAAVTGTIPPFDAFNLALVPLMLWLVYSVVSGMYPWSMRP